MSGLWQDVRQTLRSLLRRPGFAVVAVLALALGIGANTAIFGVIDAVLLRPLPYPHEQSLVTVRATEGSFTGAAYLDFVDKNKSFTAIAGYRAGGMNTVGPDGPFRLDGASVTRNFLDTLGVKPALGRTFSKGTEKEVVLSNAVWRNRFSAARDVIGRTMEINAEVYTIVGVMPPGAMYPVRAQLWVTSRFRVPEHPLRPLEDQSMSQGSHYMEAIGRLAPGVTPAQAGAELTFLDNRDTTDENDRQQIVARPIRDDMVGNTKDTLFLMFGAVALILLIACANVAHLLLARAVARRHEVAVRVALGASRLRLLRLFFVESAMLSLAGAGLGILVAMWGGPPLLALGPTGMREAPITVDLRVLGFAIGVALLTALVFGLLPALSTTEPAEAMKDAARGATGGSRRAGLRSTLVAAEVALSLILLVGAGLLLRSFARLESVNPGFEPDHVLTGDVWLPVKKYTTPEQRTRFYQDVLDRLRASPDVETAAIVSRLPLAQGSSSRSVQRVEAPDTNYQPDYRIASADYFKTMRIPVLAGREFDARDTAIGPQPVIVNRMFAEQVWPGQDPLGRYVYTLPDNRPSEVVGVIGNVRHVSLDAAPKAEVYIPVPSEPWPFMTFVVRAKIPPARLAAFLENSVHAVDSAQAMTLVMTMEERVDFSLTSRRFTMLALGALAGLALVLALVGIYGVVAYSVAQRTRELGIRLALGARPGSLLAMVVQQSLRPVIAGVAVGVIGALLVTRVLSSAVYGVGTTDPLTFAGVALLLATTAALASLAAARKATKVDPMTALRSE